MEGGALPFAYAHVRPQCLEGVELNLSVRSNE